MSVPTFEQLKRVPEQYALNAFGSALCKYGNNRNKHDKLIRIWHERGFTKTIGVFSNVVWVKRCDLVETHTIRTRRQTRRPVYRKIDLFNWDREIQLKTWWEQRIGYYAHETFSVVKRESLFHVKREHIFTNEAETCRVAKWFATRHSRTVGFDRSIFRNVEERKIIERVCNGKSKVEKTVVLSVQKLKSGIAAIAAVRTKGKSAQIVKVFHNEQETKFEVVI